jgi:hypothetical protein
MFAASYSTGTMLFEDTPRGLYPEVGVIRLLVRLGGGDIEEGKLRNGATVTPL